MIYNIITRLHYRNTDYIILKFHEDTFVSHESCTTNLPINFTFEHENNKSGYTQTINASFQTKATVFGIVSNPLGEFMYTYADLLHSVIIDIGKSQVCNQQSDFFKS